MKTSGPFPLGVGKTFHDRPWAPEMVVLPTGSFRMGSTEEETTREGRAAAAAATERPQHDVAVTVPIAIGAYLVTRAQYRRFVVATKRVVPTWCTTFEDEKWLRRENRSYLNTGSPATEEYPVSCVDWEDAQAYAAWLSKQTGKTYRLVHEAEWEYAARAGTTTVRWWGDEGTPAVCTHANGADKGYTSTAPDDKLAYNACDDGFLQSSPGTAFPPNAFGVHDTLGNLEEWTADCFAPDYRNAPTDAADPVTNSDCARRAVRGGSWHGGLALLRSAARIQLPPDVRATSVGFRVARLADK